MDSNDRPAASRRVLSIALAAIVVALAIGAVVFALRPGKPGGPEAIVWGRDTCAECKMHLSEKGFAAEAIAPSGQIAKYDDIGCLLRALAAQGDTKAWVQDHTTSAWVEAEQAAYVRAASVKTPMGHGLVAFADKAAATAFAKEHRGQLTTWSELRRAPPGAAEPPLAVARPGDKRPLTAADARDGKALYLRECSACHGERGDGQGPAAQFVDPIPRNLLKAKFKLKTTPAGKPFTAREN